MMPLRNAAGFSFLKLLMWVTILAVCAAAGLFAYNNYLGGGAAVPRQTLPQVKLKTELIAFTFQMMPQLYDGLESLNDRLVLIDGEIERLDNLEREFPKQKRVVAPEKNTWKHIRKELLAALAKLERGIEKIYVADRVNPATGRALMESEQSDLLEAASAALAMSDEMIGRLGREKPPSLLDKLKDQFSSK